MGDESEGGGGVVGSGVDSVKKGDPVICHPLLRKGNTLGARRGSDRQAGGAFRGIDSNGGYAELLKTGERALIKLPRTLAPKDVAPHADAGLTAYHAAKKASRHLQPGEFVAVIGVGGLGHIGIQALKALCAAEIIAVDRSDTALNLARECGAEHIVKGDANAADAVLALTNGGGAQAVFDFVGEGDSGPSGLKVTAEAGYYYIVGYRGQGDIPPVDMNLSEKTIGAQLVR